MFIGVELSILTFLVPLKREKFGNIRTEDLRESPDTIDKQLATGDLYLDEFSSSSSSDGSYSDSESDEPLLPHTHSAQ
jgi:hypothetical protein